jgi:hypothetical protein
VKLSGRAQAPRALLSVIALRARYAPFLTTVHGPLERWLEVLALTSNEGIFVPWRGLTARRRAPPTLSEGSGTTKPPRQNARPDAAAQPDEFRVGNCAAEQRDLRS